MSDFLEPIGNEEAILQNILGANNELLPPMSRNEKILLDILGDDYPIDPPMSRMEALLIALKEKIEHDTPSGKINITENGNDIDIAQYATADVNVSGGADLGTKSITANGTYAASADNLDGYDEVTVNVPDTAYELLARTIKSLTIPNTTTQIREYFCFMCNQLEEIIFEETSTLTRIDQHSFHGCTSLKSLIMPASVQDIYQNAFNGCTGLITVSLSDGITQINNYAFAGCSSLINLTLPQYLVTIASAVFRNCTSLKNIKFPATLTTIVSAAFERCLELTEVDCTELTTTNGEVNTTLGESAFRYTSQDLQLIFADAATMNVYANATNWIDYASKMTYVGA